MSGNVAVRPHAGADLTIGDDHEYVAVLAPEVRTRSRVGGVHVRRCGRTTGPCGRTPRAGANRAEHVDPKRHAGLAITFGDERKLAPSAGGGGEISVFPNGSMGEISVLLQTL